MTTTNLKLPTTLTETFCFLTRLAMDSGMNEQEAKQEAKNVINILTLN